MKPCHECGMYNCDPMCPSGPTMEEDVVVTMGVWNPDKVRLMLNSEKSSAVALSFDENQNEFVSLTFRDRNGLRAFAAKINQLLDEENKSG